MAIDRYWDEFCRHVAERNSSKSHCDQQVEKQICRFVHELFATLRLGLAESFCGFIRLLAKLVRKRARPALEQSGCV